MKAGMKPVDCLIVGGGPAGLTAAIYLARFLLSVTVVDAGHSRAATIPLSHNHAGFPNGIVGADLVARMRAQAIANGAQVITGRVDALSTTDDGFAAMVGDARHEARTILLATGVVNNRPAMPDDVHDRALALGLLRYCPICDGYEVRDRAIGVIGTGERGVKEAVFLRSYSDRVTLVAPEGLHDLRATDRAKLDEAGIACIDRPPGPIAIAPAADALIVGTARFDTVYPALGSVICSALAAEVGAERTGEGCMTVDEHQRTSVRGLYAAGDVVLGLDQISHAMGEGGVAATTIRNDLAERAPLRR